MELTLNLDTDPSFMPPPLNVLAMALLVVFYGLDKTINFIRICICKKRIPYDLAALILPAVLKQRKLELDEQILFHNCHKVWTITTHKGPTRCIATKYDKYVHKHLIQFFDTGGKNGHQYRKKWRKMHVSVDGNVARKHEWLLDLMELSERGLMDIKQFEHADVDAYWMQEVYDGIKQSRLQGTESPYWICGYCRRFVKESEATMRQFGRLLNVNDVELKLINKVSPVVCPNCYRKRFERKRWQFIWEIISIWIFKIVVFPLFFIIFGFMLLWTMIFDGDVRDRIFQWYDKVVPTKYAKNGDGVYFDSCDKHYDDTTLIANLNSLDEDIKLFNSSYPDKVWVKSHQAQDKIDPFLLKKKVDDHLMRISVEDELTPFEFFVDYVNMKSLKQIDNDANAGQQIWNEYYKPLSMTIFKKIQKLRENHLPLHLFARYPFDMATLMDDFEQFFHQKKSLSNCTKKDLIDALDALKFLNCETKGERGKILDAVESSYEYVIDKEEDNTIFKRFVKYLINVSSLFQSTRKIKNMLRDTNIAIIERGADAAVFADQLYFILDDIENSIVAIPFFNSMRTEDVGDKGELKVQLWTVRNTLKTLYFLKNAVQKEMINKNKRRYVSSGELVDIIFEEFSEDIIDPEGITNFIPTDEDDEDELKVDESFVSEEIQTTSLSKATTTSGSGPTLLMVTRGPSLDSLNLNNKRMKSSGLKSQLSMVSASGKLMEYQDDDKTEEAEKIIEHRQELAAKRMELFHKDEITATDIKKEIDSIFLKLKNQRKLKITESTIDYYRREGLRHVRLLRDDESLRFMFEQLSRYITFNPKEANKHCTKEKLKKILCNTVVFGKYTIDEESVPRMIRNNEKYIEDLHYHLEDLFMTATKDQDFNAIMKEQKQRITLEDVLSIILLYLRIFSVVQDKIIDSADEFVVNHELFCKFVDFDFDVGNDNWSNKTRAASNLYQNVLDIQQGYVTLGQIRQTIDHLLDDIVNMECGELIRIANHIGKKMKDDANNCKQDRQSFVNKINSLRGDDYGSVPNGSGPISLHSLHIDDIGATLWENPKLQFDHIDQRKWNQFIITIATGFRNNFKSSEMSKKLENRERKQKATSPKKDQQGRASLVTLLSVSENEQLQDETKYDENEDQDKQIPVVEVLDVLLQNTKFDILSHHQIMNNESIDETKELEDHEESEESRDEEIVDQTRDRKIAKARNTVFDTIISFNSRRLTLQQLFDFAKEFREFLKRIVKINQLMGHYGDGVTISKKYGIDRVSLKKNLIKQNNLKSFKKNYFHLGKNSHDIKLRDFNAEIEWLYLDLHNEYDFCQRVYPFWSSQFIDDIYHFMESTEQIQGVYELKCAEFGQLKYSLNVNDELANKLFHVIRFKHRSLAWKQLYNYLVFILKMKYNVQKAILRSKQAEDTTVSSEGMKILLKISLNDESKWLFDKVLSLNGSKVTWKQIRNYLKKMVTVRDDMRDFFGDQERDRNYDDNKAEIIDGISKTVEDNKDNNMNQQQILKLLQEMKHEINGIKKKINLYQ